MTTTTGAATPARAPYQRPTVTVLGAMTQLTGIGRCSTDSSCF